MLSLARMGRHKILAILMENLTTTKIVFWDIASGQRLFSWDSDVNEEITVMFQDI
jgi:hypothetical protein